MTEVETIEFCLKMAPLDKLRHYMNYFINCSTGNYEFGYRRKTFDEFCGEQNIIEHDAGEDWKERKFACRKWVNLSAGSLFHAVYLNIK